MTKIQFSGKIKKAKNKKKSFRKKISRNNFVFDHGIPPKPLFLAVKLHKQQNSFLAIDFPSSISFRVGVINWWVVL